MAAKAPAKAAASTTALGRAPMKLGLLLLMALGSDQSPTAVKWHERSVVAQDRLTRTPKAPWLKYHLELAFSQLLQSESFHSIEKDGTEVFHIVISPTKKDVLDLVFAVDGRGHPFAERIDRLPSGWIAMLLSDKPDALTISVGSQGFLVFPLKDPTAAYFVESTGLAAPRK